MVGGGGWLGDGVMGVVGRVEVLSFEGERRLGMVDECG